MFVFFELGVLVTTWGIGTSERMGAPTVCLNKLAWTRMQPTEGSRTRVTLTISSSYQSSVVFQADRVTGFPVQQVYIIRYIYFVMGDPHDHRDISSRLSHSVFMVGDGTVPWATPCLGSCRFFLNEKKMNGFALCILFYF